MSAIFCLSLSFSLLGIFTLLIVLLVSCVLSVTEVMQYNQSFIPVVNLMSISEANRSFSKLLTLSLN